MNATLPRSMAFAALGGFLMIACGAAPTSEGTTDSQSEDICILQPIGESAVGAGNVHTQMSCTPIPRPVPPKPTPTPTMCGFNPLTSPYVQPIESCSRPYPYGSASEVSLYNGNGCISGTLSNNWAPYARALIANCSAPVYWDGWNPHNQTGWNQVIAGETMDQANAYLMLCPTWLESYVTNMACSVYQSGCTTTLDAAHPDEGFCDTKVPPPSSGWFWAVTWEDPSCGGTGGCMMSSGSAKP